MLHIHPVDMYDWQRLEGNGRRPLPRSSLTGRWIRTRSATSWMCQHLFPLMFVPVFSLDSLLYFLPLLPPTAAVAPRMVRTRNPVEPTAARCSSWFITVSHRLLHHQRLLCSSAFSHIPNVRVCVCVCARVRALVSHCLDLFRLYSGFSNHHLRSVCCASWKTFFTCVSVQFVLVKYLISFSCQRLNNKERTSFLCVCVSRNLLNTRISIRLTGTASLYLVNCHH